MKTYTLHRIGLRSAFKFGFAIGLVIWLLPILCGTWVGWSITVALASWLGSLKYALPVGIPGLPTIEISGVELLKAQAFLALLQAWANLSVWQVLLTALALLVVLSILTGLGGMLGALVFNGLAALSGGLDLLLSEETVQPVAHPLAAEPAQPAAPRRAFKWPLALRPKKPASMPQPVSPMPFPVPAAVGPRFEISAPVAQVIALTKPSIVIGSAPDCDIVLANLSSHQAQVTLENGRYILRDLSPGQTWVQGRLVTGLNMIKDGFTVQFGPWVMVFRQ